MAEIIPPGDYYARPKAWQLSETKQGKPQVEVIFEITQACAHTGSKITWFGFFTDKTTKSTIKALDLMGFEGDEIEDLANQQPGDVDVILKIEHEEDDKGVMRAKVRWVNDPNYGGLVSKPMDAVAAKVFSRDLRAQLKGMERRKATKPAQAAPGDDIPF